MNIETLMAIHCLMETERDEARDRYRKSRNDLANKEESLLKQGIDKDEEYNQLLDLMEARKDYYYRIDNSFNDFLDHDWR